MKKLFHLSFILSLVLLPTLSFAQDRVVLDPGAFGISESKTSAQDFGLVVTGDGQLISKPGSLFSEGNIEGLNLPYLISTPQPIRYPRWAMEKGWEGEFVIAVEILENGSVGRTYVMKSTGHKKLDTAATEAVTSWKFHPATRNGKPVVECVQIPVTFQLKSE